MISLASVVGIICLTSVANCVVYAWLFYFKLPELDRKAARG